MEHPYKKQKTDPVPYQIPMEIRLFQPQDADQVAQLFHDTVHEVNRRDYSEAQVRAWAPDDIHFRDWARICSNRFTYLAVQDGAIAGFAELERNGHIGCFYCHKNFQRCGVGRQLYEAIELKALELNLNSLWTESSITARPFFEHMGFIVSKEQQVFCRGAQFINYAMHKQIQAVI
jgi:putative acetyltransferase